MSQYRAPLRDMQFVIKELLGVEDHYARLSGCEEVGEDLLEAISQSGAKFAEQVLAPINGSGDSQGCRFDNGQVTTPDGFAEAFREFGAGGWQGLRIPVADGGQGLPPSAGIAVSEMFGAANYAWSMYPGLAQAPITCIRAGGTEPQ